MVQVALKISTLLMLVYMKELQDPDGLGGAKKMKTCLFGRALNYQVPPCEVNCEMYLLACLIASYFGDSVSTYFIL